MYIGPYRLLNLIASGQFTQIWEAIHDGQRRRLAVKVVLTDKRSSAQTSLLRREYEVGNKLDHPNVIKLYEFTVGKNGDAYLLMELFSFPNMKQLIQQDVSSLAPMANTIVRNAGTALAYLAEKNWIHCDVKPDNFLVNKETGDVKLIDFALMQKKKTGLAAMFGGAKSIQGTPSYLAPEQIRKKAPDPKSDVYSFGYTLFELATGKRVFTGTSTNDLLSKHLRTPPPPLEMHNRNVTPEFSALVKRMLAKEPKDRPDIDQFLRELPQINVFKLAAATRADKE